MKKVILIGIVVVVVFIIIGICFIVLALRSDSISFKKKIETIEQCDKELLYNACKDMISKRDVFAQKLGSSSMERVRIDLYRNNKIEGIPQIISDIDPVFITIGKSDLSIIVVRSVEIKAFMDTNRIEESSLSSEVKKLTAGLWLIKRGGT